jgi:7-cyano-7-deazaguanine synthase in queuosine biosynthesis
MEKALVLNSAGKDSLAVILMKKAEYELHSLYINVGQRNNVAAAPMAKTIADAHCGGRHTHIDLTGGNFLFVSQEIGITVAHQAALLHSIAASFAVANGFPTVLSGQRHGAQNISFDSALKSMLGASRITTPPQFLMPVFITLDENIWNTIKDDPLWPDTITCNDYPACGTCGRCLIRANWLAR